jgi:hypothetical protein
MLNSPLDLKAAVAVVIRLRRSGVDLRDTHKLARLDLGWDY